MFNEVERILERTAAGELIEVVIETHTKIDSTDEPEGTVGQMLSYRDPANNDFEHSRAYCYRRPDGSFGGRGQKLPDPKIIYHNGILYLELTGKELRAFQAEPDNPRNA